MNVKTNVIYTRAFQIAAVVVPLLMTLAGYFAGDLKPIARDVCNVLIPGELVMPGDAGAVQ